MENNDWKPTANRFVAFFDIMGFKDYVARNEHNIVVEKLMKMKTALNDLENMNKDSSVKSLLNTSETRAITFSDSIVFFSKGDTEQDVNKILLDSAVFLFACIGDGIAVKGAISFGEITVDFKNSLFFGQPIIDAYLLHDQLLLYSAIIDHTFEVKLNSITDKKLTSHFYSKYKANLKSGRVEHLLIGPTPAALNEHILNVSKLYENISGAPRIYIDNTLDFLNSLKAEYKSV